MAAPVSSKDRKEAISGGWSAAKGGLETSTARMIRRSMIDPVKVGTLDQSIRTGLAHAAAAPSEAARSPIFLIEKQPSPKRSMPTT